MVLSPLQTGSPLYTGLAGIQQGLDRVNRAAVNIAQIGTTAQEANATGDLTQNLVNLKQGELEVKASSKVVSTADEVLGTLLDVRA